MPSAEQSASPGKPLSGGRKIFPQNSAANDGPALQMGRQPRFSEFWALMGCNAIVFVGSVCIMVLELTASRLIAKHVGSSSAHLYATQSYLAHAGHPANADDLTTLSFVGMSPIERFLPTMRVSGLDPIHNRRIGCGGPLSGIASSLRG